ncbi:MAG: uracil-DNA glycosylase [Candidatus Peregrinibacteria bacterium]|nr:uracil-DNA glycosylase [Candidatus Peregrinibacteria bacterium]MCB9808720.1 uracil-DNA glycosylase [Candidatus Peribacteria bacterium]
MVLTLPELQEKLQAWDGCALSKNANPVLGEGNPNADVMFIGEAPGQKEDELGRPFVGAAGKFLDELIESMGWKRSDVYISNVVKYRPPDNRDPTPEEKEQCMPWLMLEIALIKPKVIVPLGRHSLGHFYQKMSISNVHGTAQKLTDDITIFPIYHPAAALHNGNLRQSLIDDFAKLKEYLDESEIKP